MYIATAIVYNPSMHRLSAGIPQGYPRIEGNPMLQNVEKGQVAVLQCAAVAQGMERPNTYWLKDNLPIETADDRISIDNEGSQIE